MDIKSYSKNLLSFFKDKRVVKKTEDFIKK